MGRNRTLQERMTQLIPDPTGQPDGMVLVTQRQPDELGGTRYVYGLSTAAAGGVTSVTAADASLTISPTTGAVLAALSATGVTAGTYTLSTITVNTQGRITAASSGSAQPAIQFQDEGVNVGTPGSITSLNVVGPGLTLSNSGAAATLTSSAGFNNLAQYIEWDNFTTVPGAATGWVTVAGAPAVQTSLPGRPGLFHFTSVTGNLSVGGNLNYVLGGGFPVSIFFGFQTPVLSTAASRYVIGVGLRDVINGASSNALELEYSDNSNAGKFVLWTQIAGTFVGFNGVTALAINTGYDCEIRVNSAGTSAQLFVNGNLEATATPLPTAALRASILVSVTSGTNGDKPQFDFWGAIGTRA